MATKGSKRNRLTSIFKKDKATNKAAINPSTNNCDSYSKQETTGSVGTDTPQLSSSDLSPKVTQSTIECTEDVGDRNDLYGLKFLAGPTEDDGQLDPRKPDIIAVHGIRGGAWKTWEHHNGKLWLRDFLPKHVPEARIFSFGYRAEVAFTKGRGDLRTFARSLLEGINATRISKVCDKFDSNFTIFLTVRSNHKFGPLSSFVTAWEDW
jgi:hypothetical protein